MCSPRQCRSRCTRFRRSSSISTRVAAVFRCRSELLNFDRFVAPASFRSEDQPKTAGVILVLGRGGGIEQVSVFGDQQVAEKPSKRGGFAAGEVEHLAGVLGHTFGVLLSVLITDLRMARHDDARQRAVNAAFERSHVSTVPSSLN